MVGTGGEGCDPTTGSWENCGWVEKYRQSPFEMVGNNPLDMYALRSIRGVFLKVCTHIIEDSPDMSAHH